MKTPTQSQRKHTAGPFVIVTSNGPFSMQIFQTTVDANDYAMGYMDAGEFAIVPADVLIAAPDLLAALRRMVETFDENNTSTKTQRREAIMEAASALRKAKGGGDEK